MTAEITLNGETVRLTGNAATAIRYKQVFGTDLLMDFKGMTAESFDANVIKKLAFIMEKQAHGGTFNAVTFDDFCAWLERFEESDILACASDIIGAWMINTKTGVRAKKK